MNTEANDSTAEPSLASELEVIKRLEVAGRLSEAAEIYDRLAASFPESWEVVSGQARLWWNRQDLTRALSLAERAIALAPDQPFLRTELAQYCFAMGQLEKAEASVREALRLNPKDCDSLMKLALLDLDRGNESAAKSTCESALAIDPDNKAAHLVLGQLSWMTGDIDLATTHLSTSRQAPMPASDNNALLASCLFALGRTPEIGKLPKPENTGQRYIETTLRALFNWQSGRFEPCERLTQKAAAIYQRVPEGPRVPLFHQLQNLIADLLKETAADNRHYLGEAEAPLFAVGDNQVLTAGHLTVPFAGRIHRLRGLLVVGFKAWDLARDEANPQRSAFIQSLDRLPQGARVLISAGELDTRYRRGIRSYLAKNPDADMAALVDRLAAAYVEKSAALCEERGLVPGFIVPPAPNVRMRKIVSTDRDLFLEIIRHFVEQLRQNIEARGLAAIDLYRLTATAGGEGRAALYLDGNHCRPGAVVQAFEAAAA